jgi:N-dimethylarginine dimethylaminohydrolase
MAYGHRSTKESVKIMRTLLNDIYLSYGLEPPHVICFHLQTPNYYHLDIAMLEISQTECILHTDSIKSKELLKLSKYIDVKLIDTDDKFCLNAICEGTNLLTHKLNSETRKQLKKLTNRTIIECDTSEFEKSGGSVRCMVLDIYDPRSIKRKKHSSSTPSSPK